MNTFIEFSLGFYYSRNKIVNNLMIYSNDRTYKCKLRLHCIYIALEKDDNRQHYDLNKHS